MYKRRVKNGFTVIEMLLAVFLVALSLSFTLLYYRSAQTNADLTSQVESLVSYLRLEQSNADSGLNDTGHGIHLESDSYISFEGAAYDSENAQNFVHPLPANILIQNVNLNGNGNDIIFLPPYGETSHFGSIEVYSQNSMTAKTINIKSNGVIEYQ